ncbi:membrane protein of unknown function [Beijerinckiaceae bacterium RH CH11]|nr:hypothetical protein [Beijerinckiaceae bacterium]VVB44001.1 membrane protein of unknown function [Beijerinckiaceae bacterium RH CH11]VVB44028.1 membrane protein of unknown function [Beijerinckiaceae bacterium RH AL8]
MQPAPTFGRRSAPTRAPRRDVPAATAAVVPPDHAAVFAAIRSDTIEEPTERVVPRSFRAAFLAGLVVGCCLAGLDVTNAGETLRALTSGLLPGDATPKLVPVVVLLGLAGGARAAATSLLLAHGMLRRLALTHHVAYALGGAAVAGALSYLTALVAQTGLLDAGLLPSHGLAIDTAAGAGAGFFYRVFAGSTSAR